MKKGILVLSVAVFGFSMVSCKKDFTCSCPANDGFPAYEYTLKESKKAAAAAVCEGKGIGSVEFDGQTVPDDGPKCSLK